MYFSFYFDNFSSEFYNDTLYLYVKFMCALYEIKKYELNLV